MQPLKIRTFINLTTTHAMDSKKLSNYALQKLRKKVLKMAKGLTV